MDEVKWHSNERVGIPDFDAATNTLRTDDQIREKRALVLPDGRSTGQAATPSRIFSGFGASVPGGLGVGTTIKVIAGTGLFSLYDAGDLKHGVAFGDFAPDDITIDLGAASPGTYAIYVRFVLADGSTENRVFWNPTGAGGEEIESIPTRRAAAWQATFQDAAAGAPGNGEWVKIWECTVVAGPVVSALSDYRHFFFEGDAANAYAQEWGDETNDRNADRTLAPVTDQHRWVQMVRRTLSEIRGQGVNHWEEQTNSLDRGRPLVESPVDYHPSTPVYRLHDYRGYEARRSESCGRIATVHRLFDDFNYHEDLWGTTPGPEYGLKYKAVISGTGKIEVSGRLGVVTGVEPGGVITLQPEKTASYGCMLHTQKLSQWRVGASVGRNMCSFWCRVKHTDNPASRNFIARAGFLSPGNAFRVWWELDSSQATPQWILHADDGAGGTANVVTSSFIPVAGTWMDLYISCDPFPNAGVGYVYGAVTAQSASPIGQNVYMAMPAAGATFLDVHPVGVYMEDIDAGGIQEVPLELDAWEVWDNWIMSGLPAPDKYPAS